MKMRLILFFLLAGLFLTQSCRRDPYRVRISGINVDIKIKRLEKDLFDPDPGLIAERLPLLKTEYGDFLQLFGYVINAGPITDPSFSELLTHFCSDKLNNEVFSVVMDKYSDIRALELDIEDGFRHYKYYFPDREVPAVVTSITGFNSSIITSDNVIGIGLDRYLGAGSEYYRRLEIYRYISARMNEWNIVPDCMYAWGATEWDFTEMHYAEENVLTNILHEGKLRYFEKCMLPGVADTVIFGFTSDQMRFCRNNESQMWNYIVEKELLFSTDQFVIRKLTGEAPFTVYFTNESPGRAAVWLGFRVVESFMMRNRDVSLGELMEMTDVQSILEGARFAPR